MSKARDLADSAQEINILDGKSFLDEDNLASDSATGIASQQSIKAYVDGITTTNITSTGALNSGSITSGFGNIDNGSSTITTTGAISGGSFVIGSADINENDLESIDGITVGTVAASKAVVVDSNKDITGFRNLTATGTISGTLSGSLSSTTTATTQAESDDSTKVATTAYVTDKITTLIGGAPSTLNDLNELAAAINDDANYNSTLTTALATKLPLAGGTMTGDVLYNDNIKAKFGAGSDLQIYHNGSHGTIKSVGGNNSIFITPSGSGSVSITNSSGDNIFTQDGDGAYLRFGGSQKLVTTSTGIQVTGNIANASGNLTLDVAGDIILDADGGDITLRDGGVDFGQIRNQSSDFVFQSSVSDKDIKFIGNDGGSDVTALTLDMSDAGTAIFNHDVKLGDLQKAYFGDSNDLEIFHNGTDNYIKNATSDQDLIIQGNDGGNIINALILDMSDGGQAVFNKGASFQDHVYLQDNDKLQLGNSDDIQIYHDGSNSFIDEAGTGGLYIRANDRVEIHKYTGEVMIGAVADGEVTLYHNNAAKLATSSSGVSVTGTVAATSYTGDGSNLTGISTGGMTFLGSVAVTSSSATSIGVSNLNLSGYKQVYITCRFLHCNQNQGFRLQSNHEWSQVALGGGSASADYGNSWEMTCDLATGITYSSPVRFTEKEAPNYTNPKKASSAAVTHSSGGNPNPNITTSTTTITLYTRSGYPFTYTSNTSPQNEIRDMRIYGIK